MMEPSKINRPVATVNRDAWFLRFYLWLWAADVEKVDFCRLFWGYVFAVPFFLFRFLVIVPLFAIWDGIMYIKRTGIWKAIDGFEWLLDHTIFPVVRFIWKIVKVIIPEGDPKKKKPKKQRQVVGSYYGEPTYIAPRKPSKVKAFFRSLRTNGGEVFLSGVGKTADRGVETAQRMWPYLKYVFIAFGAVFAVALALLVCGYLLWLLAGTLPTVIWALGVAFVAAGEGIAWFAVTVFTSQYVWLVPLCLLGVACLLVLGAALTSSRPAKVAGKKTKNATLGFGGAMKMGAKSVKYRTCPVIKVEE